MAFKGAKVVRLIKKSLNYVTVLATIFFTFLTINTPLSFASESGTITSTPSLTVGSYGLYLSTITSLSTPTILGGHAEQKIGDLIIKEMAPGTFITGRTIELTLPEKTMWEDVFEGYSDQPSVPYSSTNGLSVRSLAYTGIEHRTLVLTIGNPSNGSNPGEIDLKNLMVAVAAKMKGDLTIKVGGTAGLAGEVKVGTVTPPVKITIDHVTNVSSGKIEQAIGDITITEIQPGALTKDNAGKVHNSGTLIVGPPSGSNIKLSGTPDVQVVSGDLQVANVRLMQFNPIPSAGEIDIDIVHESSDQPATIKISGIKLDIDRSIPMGPVPFGVLGDPAGITGFHGPASWGLVVAGKIAANVDTDMFGNSVAKASFSLDKSSYTVNGSQNTMDITPYINHDGRFMLPVRYAANALGISDENMNWDNQNQIVTIIKNDSTIQLQVNRPDYIVNGTTVPMDTTVQIKNGRIMVPLRFIGQALGATVTWDDKTKTATLN
jgi:trimeric autotransporter adhesin